MSSKSVRRLTTAGALALFLLAGPAWASPREAGAVGTLWQWLATAWSAIWAGESTAAPTSEQGYGIDPNGGRTPGFTAETDQGPGMDPNGRP
jgi:hypothetical protein